MTLSAGTRIGPYEILQFTGAGGMGEVYRARDSRLNRDVALKLLPDGGRHADTIDRFRREAHALAALNHANIATIHGFEEAGDHRALVMEFVDGRTLADVIAGLRSGPASAAGTSLSLPEALAIGRQIADALEAAHEHGIVHRDLKPANIMIRPDGVVKVLDFGLAKAPGAAPAAAVAGGQVPAESLTVASPAVTHAGIVLGTAAYMSPEQARGGLVDKRTDIWAFGVVLYEMVTGRRLFQGRSVTDVLAAVVGETPDLSAAPPQVRRLLEKCLEKDPRRRLRDISAAALLLDDAVTSTATPVRPFGASWKKKAVYFAGLTALVAGAVAATVMVVRRTPRVPPAVEFSMEPPAGTSFANLYIGSALSPDGQHMVFSAAPSGQAPSLWLRRLGSVDARMLPGTERGTAPVWSPDGASIAFMADRKLKRIDLAGGPPVILVDVPCADPSQPGAWNRDGVLLFGCTRGLDRLSASGGAVSTIRRVDPSLKETNYGAPQFLPDGNRFIYFVGSGDPEVQGVYARSLSDPASRTLIMKTSAKMVFVKGRRRPSSGHLLWMAGQTLQARAFDADTLEWHGDPISIVEDVGLQTIQGSTLERAAFWTSDAGTLLYLKAPALPLRRRLVWIGADGKPLGDAAPEGPYSALRIAPDQHRAALTRQGVPRTSEPNGDVWSWDFERRTNTRITFGATTDENPVWSPDGRFVAFSSERDGFYQLFRREASGTGEEERLTNEPRHKDPLDWSPDGRYLVYREMNRGTGWDLMLLPLAGERKPITLLQTRESDSDARFSPDGRWLAYHSRMSGTVEVYVQAFSGDGTIGLTGPRLQVSRGGGVAPLWRHDGRELYYYSPPDPAGSDKVPTKTFAVPIQTAPTLRAEQPRELFAIDFVAEDLHPRDVAADGRFLYVLHPREKPDPPRLTVVTNWEARTAR